MATKTPEKKMPTTKKPSFADVMGKKSSRHANTIVRSSAVRKVRAGY